MDYEILSAVLALLVLIAIGVGIVLAVITTAVRWPGYWLCGLALLILTVSCSRADNLRVFEVSVVIEQESDRAGADDAIRSAAAIWRAQLDTDIVATYYEVSRVAEHTKPLVLLDALKVFRVDRPHHRAADATVLFTRRELIGYEGYATIGPACSAAASAIVRLRYDGFDGEVLAHELLHTVGLTHDKENGWLMSETLSRVTPATMSPDSVLTFKAAPLDCTAKIEPRAVDQSGGGEPHAGGGGAFDWMWLGLLGCLAAWVLYFRAVKAEFARLRLENIRLFVAVANLPDDFVMRDVRGCWLDPSERKVLTEFTTMAGAQDFKKWLDIQRNRAKMEASERVRREMGR